MTSNSRHIVLAILLCFGFTANAQSIFTSTGGGGDWTDPNSWSENNQGNPDDSDGIPDGNDNVIIGSGNPIDINTTTGQNVEDLTISGGILTFVLAGDLDVEGTLTMSGTSSITNGVGIQGRVDHQGSAFNVSSGATATIAAIRFDSNGTTTIDGTLSFSSTTGAKNFTNITVNSGGTWDNGNVTESFNIDGDIVMNSGGTWTGCSNTTSCRYTIRTNGTGISGAGTVNMPDLRINNGVTFTNTGNLVVTDNIDGASAPITGVFVNGNGGVLELSENGAYSEITFTLNTVGNTVRYSGSATENIDLGPFYDLEINMGTSTTLCQVNGANVTVNNNMTIDRGRFRLQSAHTLAVSGNLTLTTDGELEVNNAGAIANITGDIIMTGGTYDHNNGDVNITDDFLISGGTFTYTGTSTLDADQITVENTTLTLSGGTVTATNASGTGITLNAGGLIDVNAATLNVTNDLSIANATAELNPDNASTVVNISGDLLMSAGNYNQDNGDVNITGDFTITGGTFNMAGASSTLDMDQMTIQNSTATLAAGTMNVTNASATGITLNASGVITHNAATLNVTNDLSIANSTAEYNPNNASTISNISGDLTMSAGNYNHDVGDVNVTGDITITGGTFDMTNSASTVDAVNMNVTTGTVQINNGTLTLTGALTTNSGSFTQSAGTTAVTGTYQVSGGTNDFNGGTLTVGSLTVDASQTILVGGVNLTAGGTSLINGTMTIDGNGGDKNFSSITMASSGNVNFTVNETLTLSAALAMSGTSSITGSSNNQIVNVGTTFDVTSGTGSIGGIQLNVTGETTAAGTLAFTNSTGNKTLDDLTVSGSGIINFTANETVNVGGNLNMSGTSSLTGSSNNHFIDVTGTFDVPSGTATIGGVRLDVAGLTTLTGNLVLNNSSGNKNLTNLTMNSSANVNFTVAETLNVGGNLLMSGTSSITGTANNQIISVTGTFGVPSGTASVGGVRFTINGATTLDGTLAFTSTTGTKTFADITVNGTGNWNNSTVAEDFTVSGNITNNGTWTGCNANACDYTLTSSSGSISGTGVMNATSDLVINTPASYTNTNTGGLLVTDRITGTGTFINGANGLLNYSGNNSGGSNFDITNFTASATGNTVTFSRSGDMQMRTTTDTDNNYHNVIISTSAAGNDVSLAGNITIDNSLTLTLGDVILDANRLTIADGVTISGGSADSYIRINSTGVVRQNYTGAGATLAFPIGDGNDYSPITALTITSATFGASPYVEFAITDAAHPNRNTGNTGAGGDDTGTTAADRITRYWTLTPNDITSPRFDATYIYTDADVVGTEANMAATIYRTHPTLGILDWLVSGTVNPTNNTVSLTNIDAFGDLYAMDNASGRLPIVLLSFEAMVQGGGIELAWSTAVEINNEIYTIERSENGIDFDPILFKEGAGNSTETLHYKIIDKDPLSGRSYYRLKQTDFNGTFEYSEVISVVYRNEAVRFKVYPNPIQRGRLLRINLDEGAREVVIRNQNGRTVRKMRVNDKELSFIEINWEWSSGLYFLTLLGQEGTITKKLIAN